MPPKLKFGSFSLDAAEHRLLRDGQPVLLTPRVFDVLRVLVENAGHLVEKDRLLKEVWNDAFVEEANLNRAVSVLRKALGESPAERYIETLPKRGYRFVAPVRADDAEPSGSSIANAVPRRLETAGWLSFPHAAPATGLFAVAVVALAAVYATLGAGPQGVAVADTEQSLHRQLTFTGTESTPALSPAGTRIAFVSKGAPLRKLVIQDVVGGRQAEIFEAPEVGAPRWSPDGSELLFWARGDDVTGQYIAPVSGGGARSIATGSFVACWSPDGSTIALALFVTGQIRFLDRLGEAQRTIALHGTRDWIWDLDWSPVHGRLLVVADDHQRVPAIWTIRPDGSEQVKLFSTEKEVLAARWAPNGDAVYYFTRTNQTVSLFRISIDLERLVAGGPPIPLLTGLETDEGFGVSADGKRLVYAKAPYYSNLWLVELARSNDGVRTRQSQLTYGTAVVERPRVSPDGRTVLFNMGDESRANLYTVAAAGGTPKQLTFLNAFSVDGAWAPDGQSVAFASTEGGRARLWTVNADGSVPRPLPTGDMSEAFDVTWAPGPRIVYQQAGNRNFYIVDREGRQQKLLIKDSSIGWSGWAEYSPDGTKIAVSWNRRPTPGLWLIDSADSSETLVLGAPVPTRSMPFPIGWSPDARFIIVADGRRAAYRGVTASFEETMTEAKVLRVPVTGGTPEPLADLPFDEVGSIAAFPDGRRFVVTVYSSRSDVWIVDNFDTTSRAATLRSARDTR
jgi:Tol biopolymer transport system component